MSSRERMLASIRRQQPDHTPLYAWVFGFHAPQHLRWTEQGRPVEYWYTQRMEHLHTLPHPWDVTQDFKRVDAWLSLGLDDVLDVSVPWAINERVTWQDTRLPRGAYAGTDLPVLVREYQTPDGAVMHAVKQTGEAQPPGWVTQPEHVPLFEDFNMPRATHHLVSTPEDVATVKWLYQAPGPAERAWLKARMQLVSPFAQARGVMVQAWSAFGADAAAWLAGAENAVMLAMEAPDAFDALMSTIHAADLGRTALALENDVDMVVQRGWYSSIDFWSPRLFKRFFKPRIAELAQLVHASGKLFAYVMTTGVSTLGADLIDAGVDLLYYADPAQDHLDLAWARRELGQHMALAGGINTSLTLTPADPAAIHAAVRTALGSMGHAGGFILSPVDALFPDTPWEAVRAMIEAWQTER
jgi:hypothetical protein